MMERDSSTVHTVITTILAMTEITFLNRSETSKNRYRHIFTKLSPLLLSVLQTDRKQEFVLYGPHTSCARYFYGM